VRRPPRDENISRAAPRCSGWGTPIGERTPNIDWFKGGQNIEKAKQLLKEIRLMTAAGGRAAGEPTSLYDNAPI